MIVVPKPSHPRPMKPKPYVAVGSAPQTVPTTRLNQLVETSLENLENFHDLLSTLQDSLYQDTLLYRYLGLILEDERSATELQSMLVAFPIDEDGDQMLSISTEEPNPAHENFLKEEVNWAQEIARVAQANQDALTYQEQNAPWVKYDEFIREISSPAIKDLERKIKGLQGELETRCKVRAAQTEVVLSGEDPEEPEFTLTSWVITSEEGWGSAKDRLHEMTMAFPSSWDAKKIGHALREDLPSDFRFHQA